MMADQILNLEDITLMDGFDDIVGVIPCLHGVPESDWSPDRFGLVQIWSNAALDNAQCLALGNDWYANMMGGLISIKTAVRGLRLAMSLRSMNPNKLNTLLIQQPREPVRRDNLLAAAAIPNLDCFIGTPFTLRNHQATRAVIVNVPAGEDTDNQKSMAYCFLAAYLMKLLVKSPENVLSGLYDMKLRYKSFYGLSRTVMRFTLTFAQAAAYREALLNQSHVILTFTHSLAYTHQYAFNELSTEEAGVLSYLGFIPFSYTGMRVYTLMMELKNFTKVSLDELLKLFQSNITAPALNKIARIARTYERTSTHPNRDITFRYCTHWGSHYFASIRSRKCAHLLFTAACAMKTLAAGNQNSDPERIAAVSYLPDDMKRTLRRAGEIIGASLKRKMLGRISASLPYDMTLTHNTPATEEDDDWGAI